MSAEDILKWNGKYRATDHSCVAEPDAELVAYVSLFPLEGCALDLACGLGKNTFFLAQQGLEVVAVDGSVEGLNSLQESAQTLGLERKIQTLQVDLDDYTFPESCYDLILVVRYLNRDLFSGIVSALKPGGILVYKTFSRNILKQRPGFNPAYTIETGELIEAFPALEVIVDNCEDSNSEYAFMIGRKA